MCLVMLSIGNEDCILDKYCGSFYSFCSALFIVLEKEISWILIKQGNIFRFMLIGAISMFVFAQSFGQICLAKTLVTLIDIERWKRFKTNNMLFRQIELTCHSWNYSMISFFISYYNFQLYFMLLSSPIYFIRIILIKWYAMNQRNYFRTGALLETTGWLHTLMLYSHYRYIVYIVINWIILTDHSNHKVL